MSVLRNGLQEFPGCNHADVLIGLDRYYTLMQLVLCSVSVVWLWHA
jgi:hypothetical protein